MTHKADITQNNFFAWSLYTAYREPKAIDKWITGEWLGKQINNAKDMQEDIDFRIDMLIEALKVAISFTDECNSLARHFVVPEFYFHSAHGPYPGLRINDQSAFDYLMSQLSMRIKNTLTDSVDSNKDWVISTGSILTTHVENIPEFLDGSEVQRRLKSLNEAYSSTKTLKIASVAASHIGLTRLKSLESNTLRGTQDNKFNKLIDEYRQDPLCTVRNRASIFVYDGKSKEIVSSSIEKQAESTVDLTIGLIKNGQICLGGQITEWLANYPPVSIINGDNQNSNLGKTGARMSISYDNQTIELGAEICLDHRLQRLRRTVDMNSNSPLDIQLVPSGGMQLLDYSIAAGSSGAIFNADGCDYILDEYNSNGKPVIVNQEGKPDSGVIKTIITGVYTLSAQTCSEDSKGNFYYSHSQLAFRTNDAGPDGYVNSIENLGGTTFTVEKDIPINKYLDSYNHPKTKKVTSSSSSIDTYFTAGLGEIHLYCPESH